VGCHTTQKHQVGTARRSFGQTKASAATTKAPGALRWRTCLFPTPPERIVNLSAIEMNDQVFLGYVAALFVSGLILLVLAILGLGASTGSRVLSAIFGLGFVGYGFYLAFFFDGGSVALIYYVFVVPILLIVNVVKSRKAKKEAAAVPPPAV